MNLDLADEECHLGPLRICDINRMNYVSKGAAFKQQELISTFFQFSKMVLLSS